MRTYPFPASFSSSRLCSCLAGDRRETKGRRESPRSPAVPERGERPEIPQSPRSRRETLPSSLPAGRSTGKPRPATAHVGLRGERGGGGWRREEAALPGQASGAPPPAAEGSAGGEAGYEGKAFTGLTRDLTCCLPLA